jgi:flagellar biosynthesis regulator FlaF
MAAYFTRKVCAAHASDMDGNATGSQLHPDANISAVGIFIASRAARA